MAIGRISGVATLFVWQPVPTFGHDLAYHPAPERLVNAQPLHFGYPRMQQFLAENSLGANFLWCADVQRGKKEPLYVDSVHYNPRLSELVAECIAQGVRSLFGP